MAWHLRINVVLLITGLVHAQTRFACNKENKQARINFRSCNVISIPLQEKNNYNVTSTNFPVIFISDDVTEEVHHRVHYVHYMCKIWHFNIYKLTQTCTCLSIYIHICTQISTQLYYIHIQNTLHPKNVP